MNIDELVEYVLEVMGESVDEPAGRGCGYGITEDGQDEIARIIKEFFHKENDMSESQVVVAKSVLYKGSVIKTVQELYPSGFLKGTEEIAVISDEIVSAPSEDIAKVLLMDLARVKEPKLDMKTALPIVCSRFRG